MTASLQVGDRTITSEEILPLLSTYQLLPQLLREIIIDQAIEPFICTFEEQQSAHQTFYRVNHITSKADFQALLKSQGMTEERWRTHLNRTLRIEKFKQAAWGKQLELYYLQRKTDLDQVVFSLLSTSNEQIVTELYFRLLEGEQSFPELVAQYSEGAEVETQGIIGPIAFGTLHPTLKRLLRGSSVGRILSPASIGGRFVIIRLDKFMHAQLDDSLRQTLLEELYTEWLEEELINEQKATQL